jgi:hypothetical protein
MEHWADQFTAACFKELNKEARKYKTMQEWWETTERGDWMEWVLDEIGWPDGIEAEYERAEADAWEEYGNAEANARKEYGNAEADASARYKRAKEVAWVEYVQTTATALRKLIPRVKP